MAKFFKKKEETEEVKDFKVVASQNPKEVKEVKENKIDAKKVGKIVGGVAIGAVALGAALVKIFGGKNNEDGYSDLPGHPEETNDENYEEAPTADEGDFEEG